MSGRSWSTLTPLLLVVAGCGGGGTSSQQIAGPTRGMARFDVDAITGKVTITPLATLDSRAVFQGGAVSFTSSDLLSAGGDSGQRLLRIKALNNSGHRWSEPVRLVVSDLVKSDAAMIRQNVSVSSYAGSGVAGAADGYRTEAQFRQVDGICAGDGPSHGSLFVADTSNHTIRRIQPDGMVSTVAGTPGAAGSTDGTGAAARFFGPTGIACDGSGNVYIADTGNNKVRRMTPLGEVTTIAGTGAVGNTDGPGNTATFYSPMGIDVSADGSHMYVTGVNNNTVRSITYNGTGPRHLASSWTVDTIAGTYGTWGLVDGVGTSARFNLPQGLDLFVDDSGNEVLFVCENLNNTIRRIDYPGSGSALVTTIVGDGVSGDADGPGSTARLNCAWDCDTLRLDDGTFVIFVTDMRRVRAVFYRPGNEPLQKSSYELITLAGAAAGGFADGDGNTARFGLPWGVCAQPAPGPSATLFVCDDNNFRIRQVNVASGALHTGGAGGVSAGTVRVLNWEEELPNRAAWARQMALTDGRYEAEVQFYVPNRVSGFSFLASIEADSNVVNLPASGACTLTTLAGNGRPGALDGIGKDAQFYSPSGVVAVPPAMRSLYQTDSGAQIRAFVCDFLNNRIRYLDTAGHVGTFAGMAQGYADGMGPAASFYHPAAIALHPDGSLLVADMVNNRIRRVWRNGQVTTVAGTGATGSTDGAGNVAQFDSPQGIAVTSGGAVFVADTLNHTVRRIVLTGANPASASSYTVATVAGLAGSSGVSDGIGSAARFNGPMHLAADTGSRIYMADAGNASVRVLVPYDSSSMEVSTLASALAGPNGVAADGAHNVYVSEYNGYRIKRVDPGGGVVTIVGTGGTGFTDGPGGTLGGPMGMSLDHSGTLIVCDSSNNALRSVQRVIADAQPQGQWKAGSP